MTRANGTTPFGVSGDSARSARGSGWSVLSDGSEVPSTRAGVRGEVVEVLVGSLGTGEVEPAMF